MNLTLSTDVGGTLNAGATAQALSMRVGQNAMLGFTGTAGQPATVRFKGVGTTPAGQNLAVSLLKSDGSLIIGTSGSTMTDGGQLHVPSLPSTGSYFVFVDPDSGVPATLSVMLDPADDLQIDGPSLTLAGPIATDKAVSYKFTGAAGQTLGLGLSGMSGDGLVYVDVQSPSGSLLTSSACYPYYGSCGQNLTLPAAGSYLIRLRPLASPLAAGALTLSRDAALPLTAGTPRTMTLRAGQNGSAGFQGTAGQPVTIRFKDVATVPADRSVNVALLKPDGTQIASSDGRAGSDGNQLYVASLPASGTYTLFVDPEYGSPTTLSLAVDPADDIAADGPASPLAMPSPTGTVHARKFTGVAGQTLGLALSGLAGDGALALEVQGPSGANLVSMTCYAYYGGCGLNATLPASGSYLIRARLFGGSITAGSMTLSNDAATTLVPGTPRAMTLRAGQNGRAAFQGTAGQPATLRFKDIATVPGDRTLYVTLFNPDGSQLMTADGRTSSDGNQLYVPSLPASGTYTLFVDPDYGAPATLNVTLDPADEIAADGPASPLAMPSPTGTVHTRKFTGAAGQTIGLALSGLTGDGSAALELQSTSGGTLAAVTCYAYYGGCGLNATLPAAGSYLIRVRVFGGVFNAGDITLSNDLATTLVEGSTRTLSLRAGRNGRVTIQGTAGQSATIRFKDLTTVPADRTVYVTLFNPDGSQLASTDGRTSSNGGQIQVASLPASGSYTLFVDPDYGAATELSLVLNPSADLTVDGPALALAPVAQGSPLVLQFNGTAGQRLGLGLSGLASASYATLEVLTPSGGYLNGVTCYPSNGGCGMDLNLPAAGAYLVRIRAMGADITAGSVVLSSDRGGSLVANTPLAVSLRAGQNGRLSFNGTAGQPATIRFNGVVTTPGGRTVYVYLDGPDGNRLIYDYASTSSDGSQIHVPSLPASGIYTLFVDPMDGAAAQLSMTLDPASDLAADGAPLSLPAMASGAAKIFVFRATAGQNLGLALSGLTGDYYVSMAVQGPSGILSSTTCYVSNESCGLNLSNLAAGSYLVRVSTPGGALTGGALTLSSDRGGALTVNTPLAVSLRAGQNGRLSFNGTAGQPATIRFNGIVTTPGGRSVYVYLDGPDGSRLTYDYASTSSDGSQLYVPSLPVSGSYTVFVDPMDGAATQLSMTLDPASDLAADGAPLSLPAMASGAAKIFVFRATAGQNLGLALSGLTGDYYVSMAVQGPSGILSSTTCYVSNESCGLNLSNIAAGTYLVRVTASGGALTAGALTLSSDRGGALTVNTPLAVSLRAGQNGRLSFNGTAGQPATIRFSGVVTTPGGRNVYVYLDGPDGSRLTYDYASTSSEGSQLYVPSLPVSGTYTAFVDPMDGVAAQLSMTLDPASDLTVDGAALSLPAIASGAAKIFVFRATAGQNLDLALSGLAGDYYVSVAVQGPSGGVMSSTGCYVSNGGCVLNLANLAAGPYLVRVQGSGGGDGGIADAAHAHDAMNAVISANVRAGRAGLR
ncbi:pre-peptidase C-terminal domain-containing protein [Roseateles chitinivorans]|uniref:pre-peptidase C-terminal domain-containing protein n=1 Tax=Roseateles chitinivorans TaxID=2917965 RepID=UPI003D6755F6